MFHVFEIPTPISEDIDPFAPRGQSNKSRKLDVSKKSKKVRSVRDSTDRPMNICEEASLREMEERRRLRIRD